MRLFPLQKVHRAVYTSCLKGISWLKKWVAGGTCPGGAVSIAVSSDRQQAGRVGSWKVGCSPNCRGFRAESTTVVHFLSQGKTSGTSRITFWRTPLGTPTYQDRISAPRAGHISQPCSPTRTSSPNRTWLSKVHSSWPCRTHSGVSSRNIFSSESQCSPSSHCHVNSSAWTCSTDSQPQSSQWVSSSSPSLLRRFIAAAPEISSLSLYVLLSACPQNGCR